MISRRAATRMPSEVRARERRLRSTKKKETQVASQPKAEAMEPTSVTGTSKASPRRRPARVATAMLRMAMDGVWNFDGCGRMLREWFGGGHRQRASGLRRRSFR